jgi:hypothetical protein
MSQIGTLNEGSLHASLKELYAEPDDEFEVPLGSFVIDIKRGNHLIEVQTVSFASMGKKLDHLLPDYQILLVHPIAVATYLDRPGKNPRKSPKRGSIFSLFEELVSLPTLIDHPNLTIEVVLGRGPESPPWPRRIPNCEPILTRNSPYTPVRDCDRSVGPAANPRLAGALYYRRPGNGCWRASRHRPTHCLLLSPPRAVPPTRAHEGRLPLFA